MASWVVRPFSTRCTKLLRGGQRPAGISTDEPGISTDQGVQQPGTKGGSHVRDTAQGSRPYVVEAVNSRDYDRFREVFAGAATPIGARVVTVPRRDNPAVALRRINFSPVWGS